MQHFADFGVTNPFPAMLDKAKPYLNNIKAGAGAVKDVGGELGKMRSVQIGAGLGSAAGLARGAGIGESEEEKANTSTLGRVGKVFGNTAAGAVLGGGAGIAGQAVANTAVGVGDGLRHEYSRRKRVQDFDFAANNSI